MSDRIDWQGEYLRLAAEVVRVAGGIDVDVWDENVPPDVRSSLQADVSRLRDAALVPTLDGARSGRKAEFVIPGRDEVVLLESSAHFRMALNGCFGVMPSVVFGLPQGAVILRVESARAIEDMLRQLPGGTLRVTFEPTEAPDAG